jgi:hypothetical protein
VFTSEAHGVDGICTGPTHNDCTALALPPPSIMFACGCEAWSTLLGPQAVQPARPSSVTAVPVAFAWSFASASAS